MPTQNSWNSSLPIAPTQGGTGKQTYNQGDLLIGNQTGGLTALSLGTNAYALVADSTQATGMKWAAITPAPTVIQTGGGNATASNQTITFTGYGPLTFSGSGSTVQLTLNNIPVSYGGIGTNSLAQNGVLTGQGTSAIASTTLSNGQLLVGSTGAAPQAAALTTDGNITVTNGAGTIQLGLATPPQVLNAITASGTYTVTNGQNVLITASSGAVVLNLTYDSTKASREMRVIGAGTAGTSWKLAQVGSSQVIRFGTQSSTVGTGGSVASTDASDCITLYTTDLANKWSVVSSQGNFTIT